LSILRQIEIEGEIVVQVHLLIHLLIIVAHFQLLLVPCPCPYPRSSLCRW
jgi:hypothetical protein